MTVYITFDLFVMQMMSIILYIFQTITNLCDKTITRFLRKFTTINTLPLVYV